MLSFFVVSGIIVAIPISYHLYYILKPQKSGTFYGRNTVQGIVYAHWVKIGSVHVGVKNQYLASWLSRSITKTHQKNT